MSKQKEYFDTNRESWNQRVAYHANSKMYDMKAFKEGKSSLMQYELEALGDVSGKSLLHLQCHFGQDTLSWARMGAKATGIDLSDEAIKLAKDLNGELDLDAKFICCNTYDVNDHISEKFDIVFTSYGVIGWLPDLKPWGEMIASRLKGGGVFYMAEFHPVAWMFDYLEDKPVMKYHYDRKEVIYEEYQGTYADENAPITTKDYAWNHGLGEVVSALTEAGLHIDFLKEYDESPYNVFPDLKETSNGMYKNEKLLYPLVFEVKATKLVS